MTAPETTPWPRDTVRHRLIGDWHIYQRSGGHRTSTDDLLVAWMACLRAPRPVESYLDLGCGIGSVLLMTTHGLQPVRSVGVEAQPQSATLASRALAELPPHTSKIAVRCGDFRKQAWDTECFDVITGSPPYFPVETGVLPDDAQRRACRFEERGGIEDYCLTAADALAPGGRFFVVFQTIWDMRVLEAGASAGLALTARADVEARQGRGAFLSVYEFGSTPVERPEELRLAVRDEAGAWTEEFRKLRRFMGYEGSSRPDPPHR